MPQTYKQCQSCGMPLKQDEKGGGSEKDGTINKMYCSHCYENGKFTSPNMTVVEMQKLCDNILKNEVKMPRILRWLAVRQIPSLARWQVK